MGRILDESLRHPPYVLITNKFNRLIDVLKNESTGRNHATGLS
ncbi:MAG: hypothetical protein ACKER6_01105 [Candidatus Hodgkinia cicadicola]